MKLELGKCYTVQKLDRSVVTFKFIGNNPNNPNDNDLYVEIDDEILNLYEIIDGGYLAYYEVICD